MLVYGDPKFSVRLGAFFENFRSRAQQIDFSSLDDLRSLLIFAGQMEQAISDQAGPSGWRELEAAAAHVTDCLAQLFCRKFTINETSPERTIAITALERMATILRSAPRLAEELVTVKIPEGYAFYALFPDQYCVTALRWARQISAPADALIVGIRSIGTSLSAVVKETLRHAGWTAARYTVRPDGHPFQRRWTLGAKPKTPDVPVLIVDEGPGISGSSMAAVAEAFSSAGFCNLSFLPGHSNDPGSASPHVLKIWRRVPRFVTPLEDVKWNCSFEKMPMSLGIPISLESALLARAQELTPNAGCQTIRNISGGVWKEILSEKVEWPTSPQQFERLKFLCTGSEGTSVLWKFAGLHCEVDGSDTCKTTVARLSKLAGAGYTAPPLAAFRGFIATSWVQGARLIRGKAENARLLRRVGNYIVAAAQPGLSAAQNQTAIARLAEMLHANTKESLGETFAQRASAMADAAFDGGAELSYGDGHLAPHEWIRAADDTIFKVDAEGHFADHTLIGAQSVLWDIAGAWVEWDLTEPAASGLLHGVEEKGLHVDRNALAFFRAAYAAFRVGLFSLGTAQVSDEEQKICFADARNYYLKHLAGVLKAEAATVQSAS